MWQLLHERRHQAGGGDKHLRILEGKPQCAISTHGDTADGPAGSRSQQAEFFLHLWNKVANKKILVLGLAALGGDVKGIPRLRGDDHKLGEAFLLPGVDDYVPASCRNQKR